MKSLPFLLMLLQAVAIPAQAFNGRTAAEWVKDLGAENHAVRDYAVWALVTMSHTMSDSAVRATRRALDDERPIVRQHAALALGRIGAAAAGARDRLVALQRDAAPEVAKASEVAALRVQVDAEQLPHLIDVLRGDDWDLQLAAADVLGALGEKAAPAAAALVVLLGRDDATLDRTLELDVRPNGSWLHWNVRESVALALGAIGPVEGVPVAEALRRTLANSEWAARAGALRALASFPGDGATVDSVCKALLGDVDYWSCRRAAAKTLAELVPPNHAQLAKVVPIAIQALHDNDSGVRRLAAEFLGQRGAKAKDAVPEFITMLGARGQDDREYAVNALRALGPVAASAKQALIAHFHSLPEDQSWRQREVLEALAAVAPDARQEMPALEALLAEREKTVPPPAVARQRAIVAALGELQVEEHAQRHRALGPIVAQRGVEAIPHLLPWLEPDRDLRDRVAAVEVLALLDAEEIVPRLRPLLVAKDAELRRAAAHALAMFADAESMAKVGVVLAEGIESASKDQLWNLGLTQVTELAPALEGIVADRTTTPLRRWGATQALGYLNVPSSAKAVTAMLDEMGKDEAAPERERQELLAVGLRVLADLDAASYRDVFARYAKADETEVREAALHGLARLGDTEAKAQLRAASPSYPLELDVPDALRQRLETTRLRLNQVRHNTLRDVLARLQAALGMPVVLGEGTNLAALDGRFDGGYIDVLGFHPSALSVLSAISPGLFSGGTLVPRFLADRIELVQPGKGKGGERR